MKRSKVANELVPTLEGTIQNQPCIYGELVESHSVYCDNDKSPYRKCHCSWYYGRVASLLDNCADEDCEYFKPNPNYKEDPEELAMEIAEEEFQREESIKESQRLTNEGWLCHRCMRGLPLKDMKVICDVIERNWQQDGNINILTIPDGTEIDWKKECEYFISWEEFKKEK